MGNKKKSDRVMHIIPFLPSILTLGSIVCGVTAIIKVANVNSEISTEMTFALVSQACWLIFAAMMFDMMDGKIARAIDAISDFGKELDSLADVISFGVAPAFIANRFILALLSDKAMTTKKFWVLSGISIVFVVCAAMRLARYNVETEGETHNYLVGLPTPAAAGFVVANMLFFVEYYNFEGVRLSQYMTFFQRIFPFAMLVAAVLMVSRIKFIHMGNLITNKMNRFSFFVMFIFFILIIVRWPEELFFSGMWIYMLWGLIPGIYGYFVKGKINKKSNTDNGGDT